MERKLSRQFDRSVPLSVTLYRRIMTSKFVMISSDSFLEPLGIPGVSRVLQTREAREQAFRIVTEYLTSQGMAEVQDSRDTSLSALPLKMPGIPFTVRLGGASKEDLQLLGLVLVLIFGF